eukprot:1111376-Pyramimonas_sp.AAC.1
MPSSSLISYCMLGWSSVGLLQASDSLESFGAVLLVSSLLFWPVSGWRGGVGVVAVRLPGVPMIIRTILRCVRRNCCLGGSV